MKTTTSLRLERALEHLSALQHEITTFLESDANSVATDFNSMPGYMLVKARTAEPPPIVSLLIGESLYQLRATLNNLACDLAKLRKQRLDRSIEYPIFDSLNGHGTVRGFGDRRNPKSESWRRIHKLSEPHQAVIEREQPFNKYRRPQTDPLWILSVLSNADRHKALQVTGATIRERAVAFNPPSTGQFFVPTYLRLGPFKGEAVVARYRILSPLTDTNVQVDAGIRLDLCFDRQRRDSEGVRKPRVLRTLGSCAIRVAELVTELER